MKDKEIKEFEQRETTSNCHSSGILAVFGMGMLLPCRSCKGR